jgi:hypothetical protein
MYLKRRTVRLVHLGWSAEDIHALIFERDEEYGITIDYLKKLVNQIQRDPVWTNNWISFAPYHPGRPRKMPTFASRRLLTMLMEQNSISLKALTVEFAESFYNGIDDSDAPSLSTVRRTMIRASLSRKGLSYIHHLVNHENRLRFYLEIAYVPPATLVDIDAMASNVDTFIRKYGWAPIGADAVRMQINLGNNTFPVYAAYTPHGFICWEIYPNQTVTAETFQEFLRGRVRNVLAIRNDDPFCLVDNATVHHTVASEEALEEVFHGRYMFSEPYCHMDKPVERGFSNVKSFLRAHDAEALRNPLEWINRAFYTYSFQGERSSAAFNHWSYYYENNETYLNGFLQDANGH